MNRKIATAKGAMAAFCVLFTFTLFLSSCATTKMDRTTSVVRVMVQFDRAYIPALSMTNKGNMPGSVKALRILENEWTDVKSELVAFYPDDKDVAGKLSLVDAHILEAQHKLDSGFSLLAVHETLEMIKKPFAAMRAEKDLPYYIDLLDTYHATMEELISLAANKSASNVSDADMKSIETLAEKGVSQWAVIQSTSFNSVLFGFTAEKTKELQKGIEAGKKESIIFLSDVRKGNKDIILKEVSVLKPYYTKVYLLFGDFARLNKYD